MTTGLQPELTFGHTAPRPFDSSDFRRLPTVRSLCELRTVASRVRVISLTNSALHLVAPTEIFRTVAPTRRPNAELRTREHLTGGEVETPDRGRQGQPLRPPGCHHDLGCLPPRAAGGRGL